MKQRGWFCSFIRSFIRSYEVSDNNWCSSYIGEMFFLKYSLLSLSMASFVYIYE